MENLERKAGSGAQQGAASFDGSRRYSISELADHFGLTMRTLRFYEEKDLLRPVKRRNRRVYSQADFDILADIVRLKAIGMTIAEIGSVVELLRAGQTAKGEALALKIAREREKQIEAQIKALREASQTATQLIEAIEAKIGWFQSA